MLSITESANPATADIDLKNGAEIAKLINDEDKKVAEAVSEVLPQIGEAIDKIADSLRRGGRMAYFGSGTSGRLGILDASEMPPTYGISPELIQAYISGGEKAIRQAVENAEDSADLAVADMQKFNPQKGDVVVAISASGNPQYGLKVLELARQKGCLTIAVTSNPEAKFKQFADIFINPLLGAEAVTGSSRMKSGTAQKMILNMLSSGAMIKLGKTYHNYMIDLEITNQKLQQRAVRFVREICGVDEKTAAEVLSVAKNVKTACVMLKKNCTRKYAQKLLEENGGILRKVIG